MKVLRAILKWIIIIFVIIFILDAGLLAFFSIYRPPIKNADAVIILGAAINTPALYNRSLEGLKLYEEGKANVVIASGGKISDRDISEAEYMLKVITKNSDKPVPVILEDQSHNTYENIKNSRSKHPAKSAVIVSDKYHLARAVLMALRQGYWPVYWSAPDPPYYRRSELNYYYLRESIALISYLPKFIFN